MGMVGQHATSDKPHYVNFLGHLVRFTSSAQALPTEVLRRAWGPLRGKGTFLRARATGGECSRPPHARAIPDHCTLRVDGARVAGFPLLRAPSATSGAGR